MNEAILPKSKTGSEMLYGVRLNKVGCAERLFHESGPLVTTWPLEPTRGERRLRREAESIIRNTLAFIICKGYAVSIVISVGRTCAVWLLTLV